MTKVYLHGKLGRDYGHELSYQLSSISEVFNAINANKKGFKQRVIEDSKNGLFYEIVIDGQKIDEPEELAAIEKVPEEVHIFPVVAGAITALFAGAIAAISSISLSSVLIGIGKMILFSVIGGLISSMFAPKAEKPQQSITEASAGLNSYYFGGRLNRAQQGQPVPVIYGHLKVGSYIIQAGIRNLNKEEFDAL